MNACMQACVLGVGGVTFLASLSPGQEWNYMLGVLLDLIVGWEWGFFSGVYVVHDS